MDTHCSLQALSCHPSLLSVYIPAFLFLVSSSESREKFSAKKASQRCHHWLAAEQCGNDSEKEPLLWETRKCPTIRIRDRILSRDEKGRQEKAEKERRQEASGSFQPAL